MFQNQTFTSRFFNGVSAVPEEGTVLIHGQTIDFSSADTAHKLNVSQFTEFALTHKGCKLVLRPDEIRESPVLEIICPKEDAKKLESLWIQSKKIKVMLMLFFIPLEK